MQRRALLLLVAGSVALTTVAGCNSTPKEVKPTHAKAVHTEVLEPYSCGTIERLHTLGGVFLASQPAVVDFEQAKSNGVKTVIDLREAGEVEEFDEPKVVRALGLEYYNLGFKTPESLTDSVFDRARALLRDESKKPILLHCSSGNRVGAVWLAHRVLDGGLEYEAALAESKTVGLKLPAYEAKARQYVERVRAR